MEQTKAQETMSSLQIAEITSKKHKDVLKAIRKMQTAWENATGRIFALSHYTDVTGRQLPCFILDKAECLFVATKFNDEARAKLILRWKELEENVRQQVTPSTPAQLILQQAQMLVDIEQRQLEQEKRTNLIENKLNKIEDDRKRIQQELFALPLLDEEIPEKGERATIIQLINEYSKLTNIPQEDVYHAVYKELYYRFCIRINSYDKMFPKESKLQIAERKGFLPKIHAIISSMVRKLQS